VADPDVVDAMRRSCLGGLPRDVVDELVAGGHRTEYPVGSTIYREWAAPRAELVVRGLLRVYMTSPEGRQVTVRYAGETDVLGIAVIVGGPVNVAVQTLADSNLFSIDARRLTAAARRDGRVAWALAERLGRSGRWWPPRCANCVLRAWWPRVPTAC
jgi:CRP/FNR family cyclic AMP-dependent transcriptional regulator